MTSSVLILGNSISAQRSGYVAEMSRLNEASGSDPNRFINASLGGVGTLGLLSLADLLIGSSQAETAIIETSASDSAGATQLHDLEWALEQFVQRVMSTGVTDVVGLHLPRFDIDFSYQNSVVASQNAVFSKLGCSTLDLRGKLLPENLTDGVHLNPVGAEIIGRLVTERLDSLQGDLSVGLNPFSTMLSAKMVSIHDPMWDLSGGEFCSFRRALPTYRFQSHVKARLVSSASSVVALVAIVGPSTGVVSLEGPSGRHVAQWADQWSSYRRIQVINVPLALRESREIVIKPTKNLTATSDSWGNANNFERAGAVVELVGALVRFDQDD